MRDTNRSEDSYKFPDGTPQSLGALATKNGENPGYGYAYNGSVNPSTTISQPFAGWMRGYQRYVTVPWAALACIILVGLAARRRPGGAAGRRGWHGSRARS